jgi:hypothetical protein
LAAGLLFGLSVVCASTQAAVIRFEDDSVEFLARPTAGGGLAPATGNFQTGDVLITVFRLPVYQIDGVNQIPAGQEITGIAGNPDPIDRR